MSPGVLLHLALFAVEIAALHVFFGWVERRLPERPRVDLGHLTAEERRRIAKRADRLGTITGLILLLPLFAAWGFGFYFLELATVPAIPGTRFVRLPHPAIHLIPGIFAALALVGPIGLGVMLLVYRDRFHEVMAAGDAHFRFDVRKLMYATFVWVVPLCVDAEAMVLGRCIVFADDGVYSRGVTESKGIMRPYSDVAALYGVDGQKVLHRELVPDRRFLVVFKDGARAPSWRFLYDGPPDDLEPLRFAAQKTGLPIQWVREFPD